MLLIVDNNDSFTYNLVQLVEEATTMDYCVLPSEQVEVSAAAAFSHIMFSPGPGLPQDFPIMQALLQAYETKKSFLGICLGHQAIAQHYGGHLLNLSQVVHGQQKKVYRQSEDLLFEGLPQPFEVGLYHSWVVDADSMPSTLATTALSEQGRVMAVCHKSYNVRGLQFHPESIMTPQGICMVKKWLVGQ